MNKEELRKKAKQIAKLEMESRKQDNNLEELSSEINNIIDTLSIEEIFELDKYIRRELKCY